MITIEYMPTMCNDQIRVTNTSNKCFDMRGSHYIAQAHL